jgi:hypothetical protein
MGYSLEGWRGDENDIASRPGHIERGRASVDASAIGEHVDASKRVQGDGQSSAED